MGHMKLASRDREGIGKQSQVFEVSKRGHERWGKSGNLCVLRRVLWKFMCERLIVRALRGRWEGGIAFSAKQRKKMWRGLILRQNKTHNGKTKTCHQRGTTIGSAGDGVREKNGILYSTTLPQNGCSCVLTHLQKGFPGNNIHTHTQIHKFTDITLYGGKRFYFSPLIWTWAEF